MVVPPWFGENAPALVWRPVRSCWQELCMCPLVKANLEEDLSMWRCAADVAAVGRYTRTFIGESLYSMTLVCKLPGNSVVMGVVSASMEMLHFFSIIASLTSDMSHDMQRDL